MDQLPHDIDSSNPMSSDMNRSADGRVVSNIIPR